MTTDLIFQMELLLFCWKYFIEKVYKLISLTIGTSLPSQWMLFATLIHFAKKILQQPKPFVSISIELYSSSFNKLRLVILVKFSSIVWGQPRLEPIVI